MSPLGLLSPELWRGQASAVVPRDERGVVRLTNVAGGLEVSHFGLVVTKTSITALIGVL